METQSNLESLQPIKGRASDADLRAKAFAAGCRWQCKRVKAWVNAEECVARYIAAKGSPKTYSPCLECSLVLQQLKAMARPLDGVSHVTQGRGGPIVSPAPRPAPMPAPMPKEKIVETKPTQGAKNQEKTTMSRPAKKRTADPIMSEVKAAAAPALEVVKPQAPKPEAFDPFSAWPKYDTLMGRKQRALSYVRITPKAVYFSTRCVENLKLAGYESLDVHIAPDLSGLAFQFYRDGSGTFTLSKRLVGKTELKISGAGIMKTHRALAAQVDKKFEPIVHGPGRVSVLFGREVAA